MDSLRVGSFDNRAASNIYIYIFFIFIFNFPWIKLDDEVFDNEIACRDMNRTCQEMTEMTDIVISKLQDVKHSISFHEDTAKILFSFTNR